MPRTPPGPVPSSFFPCLRDALRTSLCFIPTIVAVDVDVHASLPRVIAAIHPLRKIAGYLCRDYGYFGSYQARQQTPAPLYTPLSYSLMYLLPPSPTIDFQVEHYQQQIYGKYSTYILSNGSSSKMRLTWHHDSELDYIAVFGVGKLPYGSTEKNVPVNSGGALTYLPGTSRENAFNISTRSRRFWCSNHDPPPHCFIAELPPFVLHLLGTLLGLLAGLFLTAGALIVSMVKTISPLEVSGLRSLVACGYLIPLILYFRPKHDFGRRHFVELLGVSLVFCVKFTASSIGSTMLPLSEFSLLCNTVPVFTAFFGCALLTERCGLREWLSCIVVMLGVATTFVPNIVSGCNSSAAASKGATLTEGYFITVSSALCSAIALCWLRRLKEVSSSSCIKSD
ncbi:hypothetical protein BIW11_04351 [Tropilaelaps mercedesae]|uniref:EamA domain-containing protein n=1 Tax=Tropilaelaps mercedesae TaxID=418985 RepID=A0A1V9X829_9ACAR|nr:hypothetical protein BIW11_04351 [Tropilaelaps mercedesae]